MSNRPGHLTIAERIDVARAVCAWRADRHPWKRIEDWVGISSAQLRRYVELMQQQNPLMQHPADCDQAATGADATAALRQ